MNGFNTGKLLDGAWAVYQNVQIQKKKKEKKKAQEKTKQKMITNTKENSKKFLLPGRGRGSVPQPSSGRLGANQYTHYKKQ